MPKGKKGTRQLIAYYKQLKPQNVFCEGSIIAMWYRVVLLVTKPCQKIIVCNGHTLVLNSSEEDKFKSGVF